MSTISVDANGQLRVVGTGRIDSMFSIELAEALLRLPVLGEHSVDSVLKRLTDKSRASFNRLVDIDDKLRETAEQLKTSWPFIFGDAPKTKIKPEDILEEILVDCAPLMMMIFTTDGERFVSPNISDYKNVYTFKEFEAKYGRSVEEHVENVARYKIKNLERVIGLTSATPVEYEVCLTSSDAIQPSRNVKAYSKEQIYIYARRLRMEVMSADPVSN